MNLEKWEQIKGKVLDNFDVINQDTIDDKDGHGHKEIIEFNGPMGEIRLEFNIRDLILEQKTSYSRRIGSGTKVDYVYSDTEKTYKLKAYKKEAGESSSAQATEDRWEEIESGTFAG